MLCSPLEFMAETLLDHPDPRVRELAEAVTGKDGKSVKLCAAVNVRGEVKSVHKSWEQADGAVDADPRGGMVRRVRVMFCDDAI